MTEIFRRAILVSATTGRLIGNATMKSSTSPKEILVPNVQTVKQTGGAQNAIGIVPKETPARNVVAKNDLLGINHSFIAHRI